MVFGIILSHRPDIALLTTRFVTRLQSADCRHMKGDIAEPSKWSASADAAYDCAQHFHY